MAPSKSRSSTDPPTVEFFHALEVSRTTALVQRNMELARELHAPEYQLITPAGKKFNREDYFREITTGTLRYSKWGLGQMEVRVSSAMAIVRYRARLEFPSGNSVTCWHTDSYELRGETWQAVWSQATAIASPV